ncbi:hypothetical protein KFK09_001826 [Dendrobium nobile]|uniref:Uncharacterized protein n=1 Tax=Dendrobium nobile TaxID=94219 RepID=A0A8T3CAM7_DENNO|nr:hypothetical protein KFK09_001826 [Dendrobium nobile]
MTNFLSCGVMNLHHHNLQASFFTCFNHLGFQVTVRSAFQNQYSTFQLHLDGNHYESLYKPVMLPTLLPHLGHRVPINLHMDNKIEDEGLSLKYNDFWLERYDVQKDFG